MILEIITIIGASLTIALIYMARIKSSENRTFLFSERFLQKADERIFDFVKFVFKLYSLLMGNISTFVSKIPHRVIHLIHKISHTITQKSSEWVEKITHKTIK